MQQKIFFLLLLSGLGTLLLFAACKKAKEVEEAPLSVTMPDDQRAIEIASRLNTPLRFIWPLTNLDCTTFNEKPWILSADLSGPDSTAYPDCWMSDRMTESLRIDEASCVEEGGRFVIKGSFILSEAQRLRWAHSLDCFCAAGSEPVTLSAALLDMSSGQNGSLTDWVSLLASSAVACKTQIDANQFTNCSSNPPQIESWPEKVEFSECTL
ncbi:MAG: hypothetical protein HY391_05660 [Deltaproteobacteria bacterium]|nr:hypothetical protein [Deltaproteobacteria bacterium]